MIGNRINLIICLIDIDFSYITTGVVKVKQIRKCLKTKIPYFTLLMSINSDSKPIPE